MEDNNTNDQGIKTKIEELEKRIEKIENKIHRDQTIKKITYIIYVVALIGISIFAYIYYNSISNGILGLLK